MSGRAAWQQLSADLACCLHSKGFDIAHAFPVQLYNARSPPSPLPTFGRPCTLAILIGNSRHLWRHFVQHLQAQRRRRRQGPPDAGPSSGDELDPSNPLDAYTTDAIEACVQEALPGLRTQVRVDPRPCRPAACQPRLQAPPAL
jgi:methylmalonic aciduria homocystinuria type C protein